MTVEAHVGFNDIQALLAAGVYMADSYLDLFKVVHKRVKLPIALPLFLNLDEADDFGLTS